MRWLPSCPRLRRSAGNWLRLCALISEPSSALTCGPRPPLAYLSSWILTPLLTTQVRDPMTLFLPVSWRCPATKAAARGSQSDPADINHPQSACFSLESLNAWLTDEGMSLEAVFMSNPPEPGQDQRGLTKYGRWFVCDWVALLPPV